MSDPITLKAKLAYIQQALVAQKGQTNTFGKYKYRSCEDILEAVKPLLGGLSLTLSDEVVMIGDRYYVRAAARLSAAGLRGEGDAGDIVVTAFAREPDGRKGMDDAQVTGSTSSYARKYALNGLFAIDDARDPDTLDNRTRGADKTDPLEVFKGLYWELSGENQSAVLKKMSMESVGRLTFCDPAKVKKGITYMKELLNKGAS